MISKHAWTGGDTPPEGFNHPQFRKLRQQYFRETLAICGGLDLWVCAGTTSLERARIFWNQSTLDAWRTGERHKLFN